jgi:hypothetical protein
MLLVCLLLYRENGGNKFLGNFGELIPDYTDLHPRRQYSSYLYLLSRCWRSKRLPLRLETRVYTLIYDYSDLTSFKIQICHRLNCERALTNIYGF